MKKLLLFLLIILHCLSVTHSVFAGDCSNNCRGWSSCSGCSQSQYCYTICESTYCNGGDCRQSCSYSCSRSYDIWKKRYVTSCGKHCTTTCTSRVCTTNTHVTNTWTNTQHCGTRNGSWSTGSWGGCSVSCGGGVQTRGASCNATCGGSCGARPETSRSCNTHPCCINATPRCGTADKQIFLNTDTSYNGFSQCLDGATTTNGSFPSQGNSITWQCSGYCGNAPVCIAYRNRYPLFDTITCPSETYQFNYAKIPCLNGTDCNNTKTCANPAACLTQELDYSENFVDKKAICYLPKTCNETNAAVNGNRYDETKPNNPPYQIITGLANGNNQACYRKKECSEIEDSDWQKELVNDPYKQNQAIKFPYQTGNCVNTITDKYLSLPTGYNNGSNDAQCNVCVKVSDPWFQVVNGNLYANGDIKGSSTSEANVYEVRGIDCGSHTDQGVGIPVSSSDIKSLSSQIGESKNINLSPGAVTVDKEDYDFFARSLGYLPEELNSNLKACPSNLNSHHSNDFTNKDDSLICYEHGDLTLSAPLTLSNTENKVIFVNGDLKLKAPTSIQSGGFLLFVVSGNIIIDPSLGHFPAPADLTSAKTSSCINPNETTIDLHGLFIADGTISIASGASADNQSNYWHSFTSPTANLVKNGQGAACDKKLTLKGSFVGWGQADSSLTSGTLSSTKKGMLISRTFVGCIKGFTHSDLTTPYQSYLYNFNASIPVVTFVYDVNLVKAMPAWTQVSARLKLEVR